MAETRNIEASASVSPVLDEAVNEQIKQYNKAVRLAKLSSILLEKISFHISPDALREKTTDLKREMNVETEILHYDAASGVCLARINWTITMRYKRKRVAKCFANYMVIYNELKACPENTVQMFIDHVGKTATYAYFRALYAHLDWSANLRSPPLPVVHFNPTIGRMKSNVPKERTKKEKAEVSNK